MSAVIRCCLASSKSKESIAGTNGLVSVPLGSRVAVSGGIVDGGSAATLTFFGLDLRGDSEAALRFDSLATAALSFGSEVIPDADRVVGIFNETALESNRMQIMASEM